MLRPCFGLPPISCILAPRPFSAPLIHHHSLPRPRTLHHARGRRLFNVLNLVTAKYGRTGAVVEVFAVTDLVQTCANAALRRARDPGVLLFVCLALLVGWILGKRNRRGRWMKLKGLRKGTDGRGGEIGQDDVFKGERDKFDYRGTFEGGERFFHEVEDDGENSLWLNASLRSAWTLFRKSTSSLVTNVLQPSLDGMELPESIERIEIADLRMGDRPPLIRKIRRLPCRALSEIQYSFNARLVSDSSTIIDLLVHTKFPFIGRALAIPVRVSSLDITAKTWLAARLIPYPPYIQSAQWSLLKLPRIRLDLRAAKVLPISTIPILSALLTRVLTKVLPREFLFPKFQAIKLHNDVDPLLKAKRGRQMTNSSANTLRREYPELYRVFESIDLDSDGRLTPSEVSAGLTAWGYSSLGDQTTVFNLLDADGNKMVNFQEFATKWPQLKDSLVPQRYTGVIGGVIQKASSLPCPIIGFANPYAVFTLGTQTVTTRRDRDSGKTGKAGEAIWMESWEILVEDETTEALTIEVRDASWFAVYAPLKTPVSERPQLMPEGHEKILAATERGAESKVSGQILGRGRIPVSSLVGKGFQRLVLDFNEGQGKVRVDLSYAKFVDPTTAELLVSDR
eukprot:Plantae.Rhodophyta-Hildenbrandia_rubra.ctg1905.p1 GENE.Plantae.Rhodophyta-Hildenbrandia_rubra.ctg1905~~Plantae.Rhodophyta-Hildenbrandia_rubra.ctg1905.p1  ORF type:complete len:624 (+),score=64.62 Plantae.Rhodophyta-Hildenbrandia_rubra.ctg1905:1016-2887(+)